MRVSYEPGGMLTIVADDGIAVLPGGLPQDLIDEVWAGLDSGDGAAAVLEAMTRAFGPATDALPPFAVALLQDDAVRVAVRGDLRVGVEALGGASEVTDDHDGTWTVRLIEDALSVHVRPAQDSPAVTSELPIGSGAVLASHVRAVFFEAEEDEPGRSTGDDARDVPVPDDLVHDADPQDAPGAAAQDENAIADTIVVPPRTAPPHATAEPAAPAPAEPGEQLGDHDGATISAAQLEALRAAGAVEETPAAPAEAEDPGDHDGVTIAFHTSAPGDLPPGDLPPGDVPPGGVPADAAGPLDPAPVSRFDVPSLPPLPPPPAARGRIRLSTGETVELDRPVIIGRRPRSARTTGADMPRLVAVESPQNDISRNHIEIASDGETVVVTDLHTTNGTVLRRSGVLGASADPVRLHPGEQTVVVSGDVVDIGDGVTIAFEELP